MIGSQVFGVIVAGVVLVLLVVALVVRFVFGGRSTGPAVRISLILVGLLLMLAFGLVAFLLHR